jgi:hypothetical protein
MSADMCSIQNFDLLTGSRCAVLHEKSPACPTLTGTCCHVSDAAGHADDDAAGQHASQPDVTNAHELWLDIP